MSMRLRPTRSTNMMPDRTPTILNAVMSSVWARAIDSVEADGGEQGVRVEEDAVDTGELLECGDRHADEHEAAPLGGQDLSIDSFAPPVVRDC